MLIEGTGHDVNRAGRALVASVIRQAVLDLKAVHTPKRHDTKERKSVPDEESRISARHFLKSSHCAECAEVLGISLRKFNAFVVGI